MATRKRITVPAILPIGPKGMDILESHFDMTMDRLKDNHIHGEPMSDANRHFYLNDIQTLFEAVSKAYREVCKIEKEDN